MRKYHIGEKVSLNPEKYPEHKDTIFKVVAASWIFISVNIRKRILK